MNKLFYPGAEKSDKPGLERHHQLVKSATSQSAQNSQRKVRESLPTDWMYNENKVKDIWNEIETFSTRERGILQNEQNNPFMKIDESAAKIRNTITNFEVQDQEFLMELMELLGEDSFVDSLDQDSILLEARFRLQQMIEEHVDFAERQASLLHSLTAWFNDVRYKSGEGEINGKENKDQSVIKSFDVAKLKDLIDNYVVLTGTNIEKVEILHQDMVQNLNDKVKDCQKIISQKDTQLNQLNQSLSQPNARRRNGSRVFNVRDSVNYDAELANSQRKVMELQQQLQSLKSSLSEYTKVKNSDSVITFINHTSEKASGRGSMAMRNLINENGDIADIDENDTTISVEREIEFESKLRVLASQIQNLKEDNKSLRDQILQNRQNEIQNEKKLQAMERQKKTTEGALMAANKKLENMKETYESKINDINIEQTANFSANSSADASIIEVRKTFEEKIDKMTEEFRKQMISNQDFIEKKHRQQIRDIMASCDQGDTLKALDQATNQFQQQMVEIQTQNQKLLKEEKRHCADRIADISRHYETLLKKRDVEIDRLKKSVDNEVKNKMLEIQIEFDEKLNNKNIEDHENAVNEYADIRRKMQGSIENLQEKLTKVSRERDTLRTLIETNDMAAILMDELNGNDEENRENDGEDPSADAEDDVLQQSLQSLKEKEIEEKVSEKFSRFMKSQKEVLQDEQKWELEQAKKFYKAKYQQILNEFREKVAGKVNDLHGRYPELPPVLESLLQETLGLVTADSDTSLDELFLNPIIPLSEVDTKISDLKSRVISLLNENEIWKSTFNHIQTQQGGDKDSQNIVETMQNILAEQSEKMSIISKENQILNEKLNKLSDSKMDLLAHISTPTFDSIKESHVEMGELIDFQKYEQDEGRKTKFELRNSLHEITEKGYQREMEKRNNIVYHESPRNVSFQNNNDATNSNSIILINGNPSSIQQMMNKQKHSSFHHQQQNNPNPNGNGNESGNVNDISNIDDGNVFIMVNNVANVPLGQISCFHCHDCYTPNGTNTKKQVVECSVCLCSKCNHLTLLPQTEEIDDLTIEDMSEDEELKGLLVEVHQNSSMNNEKQQNKLNKAMDFESSQQASISPNRVTQQTSPYMTPTRSPKIERNNIAHGNLSLPSKPKLLPSSPSATEIILSNKESLFSAPTSAPASERRRANNDNTDNNHEKENNLNNENGDNLAKEDEKEQSKYEEMKMELEKSMARNTKLKNKLSLFEKQFSDLEQQYIKKIDKLTNDMAKLQQAFIDDSLDMVHRAKELPQETEDSLDTKIKVSQNIAKSIDEMNFPSKLETKQKTDKFISYANENLENCDSFEIANEALDQAEDALLSISNDPLSFSRNSSMIMKSTANLISQKNIATLRLCTTRVAIVRKSNDMVHNIIDKLLMDYSEMSNKMKSVALAAIKMSTNLKYEIKKVTEDMNIIIDQRTKALEEANEKFNKQQIQFDAVQEKFRSTVVAYDKLKIRIDGQEDESEIQKRTENDQSEEIENLTNNVINAQEEIRQKEHTIEELKMHIMQLESDKMIITARKSQRSNSQSDSINADAFDSETALDIENETNDSESFKKPVLPTIIIPGTPPPEPIELEFVPPFVVFMTPFDQPNQKNKGFSLLPRNNFLSQSEPIFGDIVEQQKGNSPQYPPPEGLYTVEGKHINTPKYEKIRVKYIQNFPSNNNANILTINNSNSNNNINNNINNNNNSNNSNSNGNNNLLNNPSSSFSSTSPSPNLGKPGSSSQARVFVPKSKPKKLNKGNTNNHLNNTSLNGSTPPLCNTPTNYINNNINSNEALVITGCSTPQQVSVSFSSTIGTPSNKMTRVLSFDNLMPLSEDDKTFSLIGYITRYVKELPPGASIEKRRNVNYNNNNNNNNNINNNNNSEAKQKLSTSDLLISEVPLEKLRLETSPVNTSRSMSTTQKQQQAKKAGNDQQDNAASTVKSDWIDKFSRRIKNLEGQLRDKTNQLLDERDRSHRAIQVAFKANTELQQSKRSQKKARLLHEATKKRLSQALDLVSRSDSEVARLKKLLNEVGQIARNIQEKEEMEKNKGKEGLLKYERKAFSFRKESKYDDEASRLLSVFRGVATGLTHMAEQEINNIRRWTPKKEAYILNERMKLLSALEAMNFITAPIPSPTSGSLGSSIKTKPIKKPRNNSARSINSIQQQKLQQQQQKNMGQTLSKSSVKATPLSSMQKTNNNRPKTPSSIGIPSYEKALIVSNATNQKIHKSLKNGVVGIPSGSLSDKKD